MYMYNSTFPTNKHVMRMQAMHVFDACTRQGERQMLVVYRYTQDSSFTGDPLKAV